MAAPPRARWFDGGVFGPPRVPSVDASSVPPDAYLLDVREPEEWDAGHADGAVHLPLGDLPARLAEVPTDRSVVVVCKVGGRSAHAVAWLVAQGYDAVNLEGGMLAWAGAKRPVVTDDGRPGFVA
jgi:rhodanese-related sulfurtransferase